MPIKADQLREKEDYQKLILDYSRISRESG